MQEPPADRAATGNPADPADSGKIAEIRQILIGPQLDRIDALQHRMDDPAVRSAETAKVLPAAVRAASGKQLRDAIEPVFEKSFQNSVRKHPRDLSDAISPVMGPAIRAAIVAAIRDAAESLNQIVEKSASWRALRWRMEARITGRPFSQILLLRSLLYSVEQVFLIHRKSGVLLMHLAAKNAVVKDADMVSGMFTAIQDFVSDSFTEGGNDLETIDVGRYKLWMTYGSKALLVGAVSGTAPVELRSVFRNALDQIHETLFAELDTFKQDDLSVFEPARPFLESCLLGQRADKNRSFVPWLVLTVIVGLIGWFAFVQIRSDRRWNGYIDALRRQPGIAVLRAEKNGSGGVIAGLKDPKAPDPSTLLADFRLERSRVRFDWQPYHSLNTPFASERALEADLDYIQKQTIRFELGIAKLPLAEAGRIEDLAAAMTRIHQIRPEARITIAGHTDGLGSEEANSRLSVDRAINVSQALIAQGVSPTWFSVIGVGSSQTLRAGATEWDQSANRSVSFRVDPGAAPPR